MAQGLNTGDRASIFLSITRRPIISLMTIILCFAGLCLVISKIEPAYTAQAMLILPASPDTDLIQRSSNPNVAQSDPFTIKSYNDIAKSDQICLDVIRSLNLIKRREFEPKDGLLSPLKVLLSHLVFIKSRPLDEAERGAIAEDQLLRLYKKKLSAVNDGHSLTLLLTFQAEDARLAAVIVNQHATSFIDAQIRYRTREAETKTAWLKKQLDAAAKEARDAQVSLQSSSPDAGRGFNPAEHAAELKARQAVASAKQSVYDSLLSRFMVLDAEQRYVEPNIRIASLAPIPFLPSYPNIPLFAGTAFIIAVVAGVSLASALEWMSKPVDAIKILRASGQKTFGLVRLPSLLDRISPYRSQRLRRMRFWEQVRSLRSELCTDPSGNSITVVTSVSPKSGTTTLAVALARASAASGARTLLIDLNLRKPGILACLKVGTSSGLNLIDAIENRTALPLALRTVQGLENLSLLASSARPGESVKLDLLASSKMGAFIDDLRTQFTSIIIDTSPVGIVSDALPCMKRADKNLLIATKAEVISGHFQETAAELVSKSIAIANVIVTCHGGHSGFSHARFDKLLVPDELADGRSTSAFIWELLRSRWSKPWQQLAEAKRLVEAPEL